MRAISPSGFSIPVVVSLCTQTTWVMAASLPSAESSLAISGGASSPVSWMMWGILSVAAMSPRRLPYSPLASTRSLPFSGTAEPIIASTEKVPDPCISTEVNSSGRVALASRTRPSRMGVTMPRL